MPAITLHIGVPKTASTYIQNFLRENRLKLAEHGVFVPTKPIYPHRLATFFLTSDYWRARPDVIEIEKTPFDTALLDARQCFDDPRCRHLIISSEYFYYVDPAHAVAKLRDVFGPELELKVIVYIRDQASLILSGDNQDVKRLAKTAPRPTPHYSTMYDWRALLDLWSEQVGQHISSMM